MGSSELKIAMFLFGILLVTAGCASTTVRIQTATRYSWACTGGPCDSPQLTWDHSLCARDSKEGSKWVPYLGANGVLKARYKDCMESRGYTMTRSTDIRYQAQEGSPLRPAPGVDPPGSGEVDLILWF
jgi:hypothetical protein